MPKKAAKASRATPSPSPPAPAAGTRAAATAIPADDPSTIGMCSGSVSASFPYIPMVAASSSKSTGRVVEDGKWHPKSEASPSKMQAHHQRVHSLSSCRSLAPPDDKVSAEKLIHEIIFRQSAARGVHLTDIFAANAPWRTDDALISPELWTAYQVYPQLTELLLAHGDSSKVGQEEVDELERYIGLVRFGETEQNAWKIFKRIAGQKRNKRVRGQAQRASRDNTRSSMRRQCTCLCVPRFSVC